MERYILAIDQGTTSSRALVVDSRGRVAGLGQEPFRQIYPRPGWVEHDPEEIWSSTLSAVGTALASAGTGVREIAAIGITNQRETLVAWDRHSGEPLGNAIVWQDRRTSAICDELRDRGLEEAFVSTTGLGLDPYFTGTKMTWLFREHEGARHAAEAGRLAMGTVDSWLVWRLTGGTANGGARHVTDFTNASRTLLLNTRIGRWDDDLCGALDVPRSVLPRVLPSTGKFGVTSESVLGAPIPILGIAGDQQAALVGQSCFERGEAKCTYGTGAFLLSPAGRAPLRSRNRLLVSLGADTGADGPSYVLEGSVFVAGAVVAWLRDGLGIIDQSSDVEALARTVPDSGGVAFVPAFTGLGAPHWDPAARGTIIGLTRGTTSGHIARAALEAIALSTAELMDAMAEDLGAPLEELRVDGGAARNDLLMQLQADLSGIPVRRPVNIESTAMGAAYLAGIGAGAWANYDEVRSLWREDRSFEPRMSEGDRQESLDTWRRAVERSREWARE